MQSIYFNAGSAGFACTLATQPLIIHELGMLAFNFGIVLGYYAKLGFERWDYGDTKEETNQNIDECLKAIEKVGLDWFKKVDTMEKIVEYPENGSILCLPYWRNKYRGYCALYVGKINKGIKFLEEAIAYDKKLDYDHSQKSIANMTELIEIARNKPSQLKEYLDRIAEENRQKIYSNKGIEWQTILEVSYVLVNG